MKFVFLIHKEHCFIGKMAIAAVHDQDIKNKMSKFVEQPSVENAIDIRGGIGNTVKQENIKFLFEKVTRMLTQSNL